MQSICKHRDNITPNILLDSSKNDDHSDHSEDESVNDPESSEIGKNVVFVVIVFFFAILFTFYDVGSGRPVFRARGSCIKRSTNKLQLRYYVKYNGIKLSKKSTK